MMVEEKAKKKGRRAYLDDFQKNVNGEYIYTGKLHRYSTQGIGRVRALLTLWVLSLIMLAGVIVGGCVSVSGMSDGVYVILPYLLALFAVVWVVWALGRATGGKDPMRDYDYQGSVKQFGVRCVLAIVCIAAALVGEIVYLFLNGAGDTVSGSAIFIIGQVAALASAVAWKKFSARLTWTVEE